MDFTDRYRKVIEPLFGPLTPEHGLSPDAVLTAETQMGFALPDALRQFYLLAGDLDQVMAAHNHFYQPANIRVRKRVVIFMAENQWVVSWGLKRKGIDKKPDPPVFQGRSQGDGRFRWVKEEEHCSDFLAGMVYWQALHGGLPNVSECGPLDPARTAPVRGRLPLVWQDADTQVFSRVGWVFGLTRNSAGWMNAEIAWRTAQDHTDLCDLAQVDWLSPNTDDDGQDRGGEVG